MKISKITIENFRCFKGLQTISFDTDGKITLICGKSGSGKTSILNFITWTFYNKYQTTKDDDKPLYNKAAYEQLPINGVLTVQGIIEFVHNGFYYKLTREKKFKKTVFRDEKVSEDVRLQYRLLMPDDSQQSYGFKNYEKNVGNRINEIIPESLSKYFFFRGEYGIDLDGTDSNLANAIYSMFDLNKYQQALNHLGSKTTSLSIIGRYAKEQAAQKPKDVSGTNPQKLYSEMVRYAEYKKIWLDKFNYFCEKDKTYQKELRELYIESREYQNPDVFEKQINANKKKINDIENKIAKKKHEFGSKLYSIIPYLMLTDNTIKVRNILAVDAQKENKERIEQEVFVQLKKSLIEEILKMNKKCICGRDLTSDEICHFNNLLHSMPPNSYSYIFTQFIKNSRRELYTAKEQFDSLREVISEIAYDYEEIVTIQEKNKKLFDDFKRSSGDYARQLASKIETKEEKQKENEKRKMEAYDNYRKGERGEKKFSDDYEKVIKSQDKITVLDEKIEILLMAKKMIENTFEKSKNSVRETLEQNISNVYDILSTRKEIINDNFLQEDFSLRKGYKSGGQELIDVYSYVIGMIKSLTDTGNSSDKEFPVIVDAPFSKTDEIQLSHVIATMPKIVSQVAFFTFDKYRIKEFADTTMVGTVWELVSDEAQEITTIERGEL